ncbi:hypothetical protein V6Z12_D04G152300 [Gossypium hirsutum]
MNQQRNKEATIREEMRAKNQFVCNRLKKGQLARLTVYVELGKPLVSKAKIDGRIHQGKENLLEAEESSKSDQVLGLQRRAEVEDFGSWKIGEWKQRRRAQPLEVMNNGKGSEALDGSKIDVVRIE